MDTTFFSSIAANYEGWLALYMFVGVVAISAIGKLIFGRIPGYREIGALNRAAAEEKGKMAYWVENQKWNRKWGNVFMLVIFAAIIPFCITAESQPWWQMLLDMFVILMVYDFFYYLAHRFLFHGGGPLVWVHSVHHRQKNPCRKDASYIHPIEVALGLGLYVATIALLSIWMGSFHLITLIVTWATFSEINNHNHDLQEVDRFPFKYLKYMSFMHHVHHARFTGGNFATISLLYDWLFGTYDVGYGWGDNKRDATPEELAQQQKAA